MDNMIISKTQQCVLDLMADGWELGKHYGVNKLCWLQKDGASKNISFSTLRSLLKKNLIIIKTKTAFTTIYQRSL